MPESLEEAVVIRSLTLSERKFRLIIERISVRQAARVAIIGPNGAGKSTLLGALSGFRRYELADASILGRPIATFHRDAGARKLTGVQLSGLDFPRGVSVGGILLLHQASFKSKNSEVKTILAVEDFAGTRIEHLSSGQRRRLDLYLALAHEPTLVFLDEPTDGLDTVRARDLLSILGSSASRPTILFATHSERELELADFLIVLREGAVEYAGPKQEYVERTLGEYFVRVRADACAIESIGSILAKTGASKDVVLTQGACIEVYGSSAVPALIQEAIPESRTINEIAIRKVEAADILKSVNRPVRPVHGG